MTREKMINKLWKMAIKLDENSSKMDELKIWDECSNWNSEHPEDEIFMCESVNENGVVNGFYIEDDHITYERTF